MARIKRWRGPDGLWDQNKGDGKVLSHGESIRLPPLASCDANILCPERAFQAYRHSKEHKLGMKCYIFVEY